MAVAINPADKNLKAALVIAVLLLHHYRRQSVAYFTNLVRF
jgi:hypothetical protein